MKPAALRTLLIIFMITTLITLVFLATMPLDAGRGRIFNYQTLRIVFSAGLGLLSLTLVTLIWKSLRNRTWVEMICQAIENKFCGERGWLFKIQGGSILVFVFSLELFLLTYLSIPVPFRPMTLLAAALALESWIGLRCIFNEEYKEKPSFRSSLLKNWQGWEPVQRKVFIVLIVMGIIYFAGFIPSNWRGQPNDPDFYFANTDEYVIYPAIIETMTPGETFGETVYNFLVGGDWWYGYPYLPLSAAVLLGPRLVFGAEFASQTQVNLFLLRQFISVLPVVIALLLLVYMVTRFRSLPFSVGLYTFLLLIPGVVKNNYRFWHPDGLILLLVVLTLFFLQRDRLRFGKHFYLAAVTAGLATAIKLFGLFFFLAVAGYLVAGIMQKKLGVRKAIWTGVLFILVMAVAIVISSPSYLVPWAVQSSVAGYMDYQQVMEQGYAGADPEGVYQTGLSAWLPYFELYFMQPWYFFLAFGALVIGSLLGSEMALNRLLLAWSLVLGGFLIFVISVKSFQYMLPLMVPLSIAPALLPAVVNGSNDTKWTRWLSQPIVQRVLWGVVIIAMGTQFSLNILDILYSPVIP